MQIFELLWLYRAMGAREGDAGEEISNCILSTKWHTDWVGYDETFAGLYHASYNLVHSIYTDFIGNENKSSHEKYSWFSSV